MKKTIKNMIKKFHLRKFTYSNNAVVGIVVAVLLIGLIVSVISIIQAAYIPKWMEEKEADHIEQVLVQFSELKLAIDTNAANKEENTPIATSITLGSKEFPFLMSARAYGSLNIFNNKCIINITYYNETGIKNYSEYKLGIIRYNSYNAYYIPSERQSFVYETGAVITNQTSGNSISIKPSFKINSTSTSNTIYFKIVNISSYANKTSFGGYDTIPILTEYVKSHNETIALKNVEFINITTDHSEAWFTYLNSALKEYESNYDIDSSNKVVIKFLENNWYELPDLELTRIRIRAQSGPG